MVESLHRRVKSRCEKPKPGISHDVVEVFATRLLTGALQLAQRSQSADQRDRKGAL